jgi:hypothetical protein
LTIRYEENVHVRGELAKRLVKVVHLGQDADHHNDHEDISTGMRELVVPAKGKLHSNTKGLHSHNGHAAHSTANRKVDHWVLLAILGRHAIYHDDGEDGNEQAVEHEARLHGCMKQLFDRFDLWIWWGVKDNYDGAGEADCTADLA